ncbi:ECF transporter S component [Mycoplasmatota bacterium]|nr:ECF transporter S component [Mycoplasmatota bacterium]
MNYTKKITIIAVLIALSVPLSLVKLPLGVATASFDAVPGYLAAVLFVPFIGGIIGFIGHLATAYSSGFPFGILIHFIIATSMFGSCYMFGFLYKKSKMIGFIVGVLLNTFLAAPFLLLLLPTEAVIATFIPIAIASTLNILVGILVYERIKNIFSDSYEEY